MFLRVYDSVELFLLFSIVRWLVLDSCLRHLCVTITIYVFVLSRTVSRLSVVNTQLYKYYSLVVSYIRPSHHTHLLIGGIPPLPRRSLSGIIKAMLSLNVSASFPDTFRLLISMIARHEAIGCTTSPT